MVYSPMIGPPAAAAIAKRTLFMANAAVLRLASIQLSRIKPCVVMKIPSARPYTTLNAITSLYLVANGSKKAQMAASNKED